MQYPDVVNYKNLDKLADDKRNGITDMKQENITHIDLQKIYKNIKIDDNADKDIEFQILSWDSYDDENEDTYDIEYKIRLFGMMENCESVCAIATDYNPSFYIEVPKHISRNTINTIISDMKEYVEKTDPKYVGGLISWKDIDKYSFSKFTNYTKYRFIELFFQNKASMKRYEINFKKPITRHLKNPTLFQLYESNIEPYLRMMHIQKLNSCGWAKVKKGKYFVDNEKTISNKTIICEWKNIEFIENFKIMPFKIASCDIEVTSIDGLFPQSNREGDKIIQIGTTFSKYGENECYKKHMITLGTCDPIDGVEIESYETEREVLIAWTAMLIRENPDIITGYNINGFDFMYLKDRSERYCRERMNDKSSTNEFAYLSRIRNCISEFKEKMLASSALGENLLKYYDMTGRVIIDLIKVIQREYKLESYKLDYVASYFIKESLQKIEANINKNETLLTTKSTDGVVAEQYITVYYIDGFANNKHMDGKKFKIKEVTKTTITVCGIIDDSIMNKGYDVNWCQAKDDISPRDIFRMQKGSSYDRMIIAKYCIQDCELCNKLISKLQVLTNTIGMANVCHVPLSYIFERGQGAKIYSLVAKKCREMNHLIPTYYKKYMSDEEKEKIEKDDKQIDKIIAQLNGNVYDGEDEEDGYEGAIVFEPKAGVYHEPITVLDYASLYPSSMIEMNTSHECLVLDEEYEDLPNYRYNITTYQTGTQVQTYGRKKFHELIAAYQNNNYIIEEEDYDKSKLRNHTSIYNKNKKGEKRDKVVEIKSTKTDIEHTTFETTRFAQKIDGTKGIIPMILMDLLAARKKFKNMKDEEKDYFKKNIYDGLQLAYKVTANSLYGQTGSSVSPICMKEIAATTTATGRNMLIFSKHFIENIFGKMINLALTNRDEYDDFCNKTYADALECKIKKWKSKEDFFEQFYEIMRKTFKGKTVDPYIIYGDTDSVFFNMKIQDNKTGEIGRDKEALKQSIEAGMMASHAINLLLPQYESQEYEKVLHPFIIISKKRYVGNLYETDPNKFKQKSMGIVLKRRDNAQIVKIVVGGIVNKILNEQSNEGAVKHTETALRDILQNKYGMDKFIIAKTLRGTYANRLSIAHAVLADRIAERDPGNKPMPNDRIAYAFIETKKEVELQGERIETPEYIIANNLKLDYLYYITNQIQKPAMQFLELIVEDPYKIFEKYIIKEINRRKGIVSINKFFENDGEEIDGINIDDDMMNSMEMNEKIKKKTSKKANRHIEEQELSLEFAF